MNLESIRIIAGLVIAILITVLWPRYTRLNAFFSLLAAAMICGTIAGLAWNDTLLALQNGFGSLLQQIGIIVALGSVLGIILEKTGAMDVISGVVLKAFGVGRPVLALTAIGALVGIPVFADSGFIILSRLIPSLAVKTGAATGSLTLALASGLYTTHVLVPPTPGPLAAAANVGLGNQLGLVMLIALLVSLPVAFAGYLFARKVGTRMESGTSAVASVEVRKYPTPLRAFIPLTAPIVLIAAASLVQLIGEDNMLTMVISGIGNPMIALLIGAILSLLFIDRKANPDWPDWITTALKDAGLIILITGAGGAFGAVIKASGISTLITEQASDSQLHGVLFLLLAWVLGAIIKTAQGSSTSSMIIVSSILAPLAAGAGLTSPFHLALLVTTIGGGAMVVSHANDSYFWVVSQFGRIPSAITLNYYTPMTLVQGLVTLVTSLLLFLCV